MRFKVMIFRYKRFKNFHILYTAHTLTHAHTATNRHFLFLLLCLCPSFSLPLYVSLSLERMIRREGERDMGDMPYTWGLAAAISFDVKGAGTLGSGSNVGELTHFNCHNCTPDECCPYKYSTRRNYMPLMLTRAHVNN